jgi:hypothetical protein
MEAVVEVAYSAAVSPRARRPRLKPRQVSISSSDHEKVRRCTHAGLRGFSVRASPARRLTAMAFSWD